MTAPPTNPWHSIKQILDGSDQSRGVEEPETQSTDQPVTGDESLRTRDEVRTPTRTQQDEQAPQGNGNAPPAQNTPSVQGRSSDDASTLTKVLGTLGARARRTSPSERRTYRLASSVRLPWLVGIVLFLLIALAAALLIGRTGNEVDVPQEVLNYQETLTQSAAQSVRRSANEGVDDLQALSSALTPFLSTNEAQSTELTESLRGLAQVQNRYLQLYVIDEQGEVLANASVEGEEPAYDPLDIVAPFDGSGMSYAWQSGDSPVPIILQYAPLPEQDGQSRTIIGWYDPAFFRFPLSAAGSGEIWLVNEQGQVIGARQGFTAFQELPRQPLRDAAAQGAAGESGTMVASDSPDSQEIVSFAPVAGGGPSGSLGWSVVTARSVDSISLPETDARRQGLTIAAVIALAAIVVFGWLWIQVLRPLFNVQREAERLAYGDLSRGVEVVRYDEIGLVARALERIRVLLVRRRIQGEQPLRNNETTKKES